MTPGNDFEFQIEFGFEDDADFANLHLWLPDDLLARIDAVMTLLPISTRQDFAVAAIVYAVNSVEHEAASVTFH